MKIPAMKIPGRVVREPWGAPGSGGLGRRDDLVAEAFEAVDEPAGSTFLVDAVQVVFAQVLVGLVGGKHVIDGDQDLVGDRQGGAQGAAAGLEFVVLGLPVAALGAHRGFGGADQGGLEVEVAAPASGAPRWRPEEYKIPWASCR